MQYRSTFVKTPQGDIHTLQAGSGPDLVFLHGWSADAYTCKKILQCLSENFRVSIPTLPGWHPSYALESETDPAVSFDPLGSWLDALGLQNLTLVGHSLGGVAAVHLGVQRPAAITRLVLVDAVGAPFERDHETWKKLWFQKRRRMYRDYGFAVVARLDRALLKHALMRRHHLGRMSRYARSANIEPLLEKMPVPVEFLWGKQDSYTPLATAQTMAEHCRAHTLTEVTGDHDWPLFTPEILRAYLLGHATSRA